MHIIFNYLALLFLALLSCSAFAVSAPDIGLNTLFLYKNSNFHQQDVDPNSIDSSPNGAHVQEAEISFTSDVDPYTQLNFLLSVAPEYVTDGVSVVEEWKIEPEELFAASQFISAVTLKLGKFKAAFGKHNILHPHAYSFVEAPLGNKYLLGEEGLNDIGISAAYLLPTNWYSELTLQALRGKGENRQFNSPSPSESVGLLHWKNLFDFSDELTLEAGVSYASGKNSYNGQTSLTGADVTIKWRPIEKGKYYSLIWSTEAIERRQKVDTQNKEIGFGIVSWLQYQFAERWSMAYRYDQVDIMDSFNNVDLPNGVNYRHSFALNFVPSEFSSYRFEYDWRRGPKYNVYNENTESLVYLQANFTIGAHPTHTY